MATTVTSLTQTRCGKAANREVIVVKQIMTENGRRSMAVDYDTPVAYYLGSVSQRNDYDRRLICQHSSPTYLTLSPIQIDTLLIISQSNEQTLALTIAPVRQPTPDCVEVKEDFGFD